MRRAVLLSVMAHSFLGGAICAAPREDGRAEAVKRFYEGYVALADEFVRDVRGLVASADHIELQKIDYTKEGQLPTGIRNVWNRRWMAIVGRAEVEGGEQLTRVRNATVSTLDSVTGMRGRTYYHFPTHRLLAYRDDQQLADMTISWEENTLVLELPGVGATVFTFEDTALLALADGMLPMTEWERSIVGRRVPRKPGGRGAVAASMTRFDQEALAVVLKRFRDEVLVGKMEDVTNGRKKFYVRIQTRGMPVKADSLQKPFAMVFADMNYFRFAGEVGDALNFAKHIEVNVDLWRSGNELQVSLSYRYGYLAGACYQGKLRFGDEVWRLVEFRMTAVI